MVKLAEAAASCRKASVTPEEHTPLSLSRKNGAREQIELLARTNLT
jgi:hypothetical protein